MSRAVDTPSRSDRMVETMLKLHKDLPEAKTPLVLLAADG
jgi:hypothetical protein